MLKQVNLAAVPASHEGVPKSYAIQRKGRYYVGRREADDVEGNAVYPPRLPFPAAVICHANLVANVKVKV